MTGPKPSRKERIEKLQRQIIGRRESLALITDEPVYAYAVYLLGLLEKELTEQVRAEQEVNTHAK